MTSLFVGLRCTGRQIRETASVYVQMAWVKGGGVVELHQRVSAPLREYRSQGGVTSPAPPFSPCFLFVSSSLRPPPIFFFLWFVGWPQRACLYRDCVLTQHPYTKTKNQSDFCLWQFTPCITWESLEPTHPPTHTHTHTTLLTGT
jgi:hypothetical protein